MLAYAAETRPAGRAGSPKALTLILAGHAVLIAAVMTRQDGDRRRSIRSIRPTSSTSRSTRRRRRSRSRRPSRRPSSRSLRIRSSSRTRPIVDMDATIPSSLDPGPTIDDIVDGHRHRHLDHPVDPPKPRRSASAARFATPTTRSSRPIRIDKLRRRGGSDARLRLSIDARGRVIAVEPVGRADPSFLAAARRHILRAWRYKPATEDGVAVASSTVIKLSFRAGGRVSIAIARGWQDAAAAPYIRGHGNPSPHGRPARRAAPTSRPSCASAAASRSSAPRWRCW